MEDNPKICRRCLLFESGEIDVLADINRRIAKLPEKEKVSDEVYKKRLKACAACDDLIGGVCMKCGCYPEFRAAFRKNKCPNAAKRAW